MGLTKRELFTLVAMNGLIRKEEGMYATKKQLVDNAIAYADMALRRLQEIPQDAQQKCEQGKTEKRKKVTLAQMYDEIGALVEFWQETIDDFAK